MTPMPSKLNRDTTLYSMMIVETRIMGISEDGMTSPFVESV
jgi:hypothetical protein